MSHEAKRPIYEQLARVGKALGSAPRLELLDLLAQGERSVESLARAAGIPIGSASQHLQVLHAARLVDSRREGQRIVYRLADVSVESLFQSLRTTAERQLAELPVAVRAYLDGADEFEEIDRDELRRRLAHGSAVLIDVRPPEEYAQGHLPGAISVPLELVAAWADKAPRRKKIIAYCRGPYCVSSLQAVKTLHRKGITAARASDGVAEWRAAGLPLERTTSEGAAP